MIKKCECLQRELAHRSASYRLGAPGLQAKDLCGLGSEAVPVGEERPGPVGWRPGRRSADRGPMPALQWCRPARIRRGLVGARRVAGERHSQAGATPSSGHRPGPPHQPRQPLTRYEHSRERPLPATRPRRRRHRPHRPRRLGRLRPRMDSGSRHRRKQHAALPARGRPGPLSHADHRPAGASRPLRFR